MKREMNFFKNRSLASILAMLALVLLNACGGAGASSSGPATGTTPPTPEPPGGSMTLRPLSAEFLSRKAVAYGGYRTAAGPGSAAGAPTGDQVLQDLRLLIDGGFKLIRMFGSGDADTKLVLDTIKNNKLDMKMQLGIWIAAPKAANEAANQAEIARGIALANAYPDIILAVSVGNEQMIDWGGNMPATDMVPYISAVRSKVSQPVTSDDNFAFYGNVLTDNNDVMHAGGAGFNPLAITSVIDFVSIHLYPLLDSRYNPHFTSWQQLNVAPDKRAAAMMDVMLQRAKDQYTIVKTFLAAKGVNLPIIIGETGWKAQGVEAQRSHPVNQKMYFDRLASWKDGPAQIFYFEAFDEPWKGDDDGWGLFDVNRKARYVVHNLYGAEVRDASKYTDADAVYYTGP